MAIHVPQRGTQWVFLAFWWADFICGIILTGIRTKKGNAFRTRANAMHTVIAWFMWFMFSPVSESIYLFDKDHDPYNNAPYMQWVCMNLRMMALVYGSLYLSSHIFNHKNASRYASRIFSYFLFLIGFMSILIIVVWKPEVAGGTGRTPSQILTILNDWIYVAVSLAMLITFVAAISRYYFPYGRAGPDDGYVHRMDNIDADDDKYNDAQSYGRRIVTMITVQWAVILVLVASYAILIIAHKGQFLFDGSLMYYFMTEYWVERVAPYYSIMLYLALFIFYWTVWRMDRATTKLRLRDGQDGEESFFAMDE